MDNIVRYRNWWLLIIKGFALLVLGLILLINFRENDVSNAKNALSYLLLITGICMTAFGMSNLRLIPMWFYFFEGITEIALAIVLMLLAVVSEAELKIIVATWIFVLASLFFLSTRERKKLRAFLSIRILLGGISINTGILILINRSSVKYTIILLAVYACFLGVFYLYNGIHVFYSNNKIH
jgi:uncharacterized membrane protein HdeD (DUF308 family)